MRTLRATCLALARRRTPTGPPQKPGAKAEKLSAESQLILKCIQPVEPGPPHTPEERARLRDLMIRYGKLKRRHHLELEMRRQRAQLGTWKAIDAMPHERRLQTIDAKATKPPRKVPTFTHTPPIEGFDIGNLHKE